jgi:L-seryl-tRNA(Ser) seleniumtransferase
MSDHPFRALPAVHEVMARPPLAGRPDARRAARLALDEARAAIARGEPAPLEPDALAARSLALLDAERPHLRPVINATGVLLHTGLGRAPLADEAARAVARVARGYCNLEFDLEAGTRGRRASGVAALLRELTGAEAAAVVNNNAAATLLALRALASGREVIVSRGQLVEIGGSYRLPEVFEASGARLREVGTTNKTRLADYERAIGAETAALLRVHASNYKIVGFTESVPPGELAALARARGILYLDDVGSGALAPGLPPGVGDEPTIADGLAAGADLVLASGDKLLGGPQCGLILGRAGAVARLAADPLMRALRVDKMTLAALEATLRLARDPAARRIPLWASLDAPIGRLRDRAARLAARLRSLGIAAEAADSTAQVGGGSVPAEPLPSAAVRLAPPFPAPFPDESSLARALRLGDPPVVARVHRGAILLDLRAVPEADDPGLAAAVSGLLGAAAGPHDSESIMSK